MRADPITVLNMTLDETIVLLGAWSNLTESDKSTEKNQSMIEDALMRCSQLLHETSDDDLKRLKAAVLPCIKHHRDFKGNALNETAARTLQSIISIHFISLCEGWFYMGSGPSQGGVNKQIPGYTVTLPFSIHHVVTLVDLYDCLRQSKLQGIAPFLFLERCKEVVKVVITRNEGFSFPKLVAFLDRVGGGLNDVEYKDFLRYVMVENLMSASFDEEVKRALKWSLSEEERKLIRAYSVLQEEKALSALPSEVRVQLTENLTAGSVEEEEVRRQIKDVQHLARAQIAICVKEVEGREKIEDAENLGRAHITQDFTSSMSGKARIPNTRINAQIKKEEQPRKTHTTVTSGSANTNAAPDRIPVSSLPPSTLWRRPVQGQVPPHTVVTIDASQGLYATRKEKSKGCCC